MKKFENICRCCLEEGELHDIFQLETDFKISELMRLLISVDVSVDNSLPKQICTKCSNELQNFYKFKEKCEKNEAYLHEQLLELNSNEGYKSDSIMDDNESNNSDDNADCNEQRKTNIKRSKYNLKRIKWKDQKPPFVCKLCNKEYPTYRKLFKHNMNHNAQTIKCSICAYDCSKSYMPIHMRKHSGEKPYNCNICGLNFTKRPNLKRHMELHSDSFSYQCEICGREFKTKLNLKIHVNSHKGLCLHSLNKEDCLKCKNKPKSKPTKQLCNYCGKIFHSILTLQAHIERACKLANSESICIHNIERKLCEECKKVKSNKSDVVCCYCCKIFATQASLNIHIENTCTLSNRDRSKTYICEICNRNYPTLNNLNRHKKIVHSGKIYECHLCDKKYTLKSTLQEHLNDYNTEHKCEKCNKTYTNIRSLKRHQLIHLNIKPYDCSVCNKSFRAKEHLNAHMVTHTGEKNFACNLCKKRFTLKATLNTHLKRMHNGNTQTQIYEENWIKPKENYEIYNLHNV